MDTPAELDALFRQAVAAIDSGGVATLNGLLAVHPALARERLDSPGEWLRGKVGRAVEPGGFFERPFLLWFVAEDPVRNGKLPRNIADVARAIIATARRQKVENLQEQLDYALRLVAYSWIARECDVQIELIDALVDAGASPDGQPEAAIVNRNFAAAERLVERGAKLTLETALCLGRWEDGRRLAESASLREKQNAVVLAALTGKAEALRILIGLGVDPSTVSLDIYSHATALHHAVCSGSLEAVRVLVEAGADLGARDSNNDATPLGWAEHYLHEKQREDEIERYRKIAAYLR